MNTLKGWITTTFLVITLALAAAPAHAGIIFGGLADNKSTSCSDARKETTTADDLGGIIFGGLTGVVTGLTGIIFGGNLVDGQETQNCGIIYGG